MSDNVIQFWGAEAQGKCASNLTEQEKALRNAFVDQYLIDFNPVAAAMRCGFNEKFATKFGADFMHEPYVLQRISTQQGDIDDETAKRRIKAALLHEANYHGPDSSQSARVSALAKLAAIYHLDGRASDDEIGPGVMVVPVASQDDWESIAQSGQRTLKENVRA